MSFSAYEYCQAESFADVLEDLFDRGLCLPLARDKFPDIEKQQGR